MSHMTPHLSARLCGKLNMQPLEETDCQVARGMHNAACQ